MLDSIFIYTQWTDDKDTALHKEKECIQYYAYQVHKVNIVPYLPVRMFSSLPLSYPSFYILSQPG